MRSVRTLPGLLLALVAAVAACGDGGEGDRPGDAVVARAGDDTLTVRRLAELIVLAQPMPLESSEAEKLVRHWLEVSLLADRTAAGDSLLDPGTVDQVTRFERQDALFQLWREDGGSGALTAAQVDSVYRAGEFLLLGHLFRAAGPGATQAQRRTQLEEVRAMRRTLIETGSLDAANQGNQDQVARLNGGLRFVGPGELPEPLERIAYALEPGGLSEALATQAGFHVLFRPRLSDVRELYRERLQARWDAARESDRLEALVEEAAVEIQAGAVDALREAARDPLAALGGDRVLARWRGGEGSLLLGELARTLLLVPSEARRALARTSDGELGGYLQQVILRELLLERAEEEGLTLPDSVRARIEEGYRERLLRMWADAQIAPADLALEGGDPSAREEEADERVERYMEAVVARRAELEPLPPLLAAELLAQGEWDLRRSGILQAVTTAGRLLEAAGYTGPGRLPGDTGASGLDSGSGGGG